MVTVVGPAQLDNVDHSIIQTAALFPAGDLVVIAHVIPPIHRCSFLVPASTLVHLAPPVPATSLTDRTVAASRSSGAPRRGLVPGRPHRTAQPASASPDRLPVPRIHPAGSVLRAAGHRDPNPARLVAICTIAAGRSPAIG